MFFSDLFRVPLLKQLDNASKKLEGYKMTKTKDGWKLLKQ